MAKKKKDDSSRTCCLCHKTFNKANFYKTNSTIYTNNGYMPVCKECFYELFLRYIEEYDGNTKKAMKRLCMAFDIYFDEKIFFSSDSLDHEVIVGNYMKRMNLSQCKGKTFDDTLDAGFDFNEMADKEIVDEIQYTEELDSNQIAKKDIKKWGEGFEPNDYKILNAHYDYLVNANPNYDSNQEIFINELCYTKMLKDKAASKGDVDDYRKLSETYRKSFQQAGLKTIEETASAEDFSIAVNVRTIEEYTPAEFYRDKALYKDFDGIGDYIDRFLLRPLRNLQHGTKERDKEFYVKEDGDS